MTTSGDTNYPPGVTGAEPVFHDAARDEDPPCADCGHGLDEHNEDTGWCEHVMEVVTGSAPRGATPVRVPIYCSCVEPIPFDEEDPYGY